MVYTSWKLVNRIVSGVHMSSSGSQVFSRVKNVTTVINPWFIWVMSVQFRLRIHNLPQCFHWTGNLKFRSKSTLCNRKTYWFLSIQSLKIYILIFIQYFLLQPTTAEDFTCFIPIVIIITYKDKEYFARPWCCCFAFYRRKFLEGGRSFLKILKHHLGILRIVCPACYWFH